MSETMKKLAPWRRARAAVSESSSNLEEKATEETRCTPQGETLDDKSVELEVSSNEGLETSPEPCQPPPGLSMQDEHGSKSRLFQPPPGLSLQEDLEACEALPQNQHAQECEPFEPPPGLLQQEEYELAPPPTPPPGLVLLDGCDAPPGHRMCQKQLWIDATWTSMQLESECVGNHSGAFHDSWEVVLPSKDIDADVSNVFDGVESEDTGLASDEDTGVASGTSQSPSVLDAAEQQQLHAEAPEFSPRQHESKTSDDLDWEEENVLDEWAPQAFLNCDAPEFVPSNVHAPALPPGIFKCDPAFMQTLDDRDIPSHRFNCEAAEFTPAPLPYTLPAPRFLSSRQPPAFEMPQRAKGMPKAVSTGDTYAHMQFPMDYQRAPVRTKLSAKAGSFVPSQRVIQAQVPVVPGPIMPSEVGDVVVPAYLDEMPVLAW